MRSLRALLIGVGLLPTLLLLVAVAYGFIGPNTWSATTSVTLSDVEPEDAIGLVDDVREWREWLLIDYVGDGGLETVQEAGTAGEGARLQWTHGFLAGELYIASERDNASSYALDFRELRAGRPRATGTRDVASPTVWTESRGTVTVERVEAGVRLTFSEHGLGGPRPIGPYVVARVQERRHAALDQRLRALAELTKVHARRREALSAP